MIYKLTLPTPPRILSPNHTVGSRGGRFAKAKAIKDYRALSKLAALQILDGEKPMMKHATIQVTWYHKTVRFPDRDNIISHLKSAFDGLTDAGLLDDDRDVTHLPPIREKDAKNPRVEVLIYETPNAFDAATKPAPVGSRLVNNATRWRGLPTIKFFSDELSQIWLHKDS